MANYQVLFLDCCDIVLKILKFQIISMLVSEIHFIRLIQHLPDHCFQLHKIIFNYLSEY